MGTEMFIRLGLVSAIPLFLLSVLLIATRPRARRYTVTVLVGSLFLGIGGVGSEALETQVTLFAVFFTAGWILLGFLAFVVWIVVSRGHDENAA
jgi:hypothetical protein